MATPSKTVKDRFGDKKKLVDALKPFLGEDLWVGRENKDKGLSRISNAKLVRLFDTFTAVQSKWGTRGKLIGTSLVFNWVIGPLLMFALAWLCLPESAAMNGQSVAVAGGEVM